jgi:hypothetical protein
MDKIVVNLDTDQRECVACGFSEARPQQGSADQASPSPEQQAVTGQRELPTRVSRAAARRVETVAEPVKLVDPSDK